MTIMRFSCSTAVTPHEFSSYSRIPEAPDAGAAVGACRRLPPGAANRVLSCCEEPAAAVRCAGLMREGAWRRSTVGGLVGMGLVFDESWWQHNQIDAWGRRRARCEHAAMTAAVSAAFDWTSAACQGSDRALAAHLETPYNSPFPPACRVLACLASFRAIDSASSVCMSTSSLPEGGTSRPPFVASLLWNMFQRWRIWGYRRDLWVAVKVATDHQDTVVGWSYEFQMQV